MKWRLTENLPEYKTTETTVFACVFFFIIDDERFALQQKWVAKTQSLCLTPTVGY